MGIPLLGAAPFLATYVITGDIQKAVVYPIMGTAAPASLAAALFARRHGKPFLLVAAALFAVIYLIRALWMTITMPTARRLQNVKNRITGKTKKEK